MKVNNIYDCDCLEGFKNLSDKSIDLVVTDPPYFLMRNEFIENIKSFDDYIIWYEKWLKETQRVLKDKGSLYIFIPVHHFAEVHLLVKKYFVGKQVISWIKPNVRIRQFGTKNWFPKTEFIGFYTKEEKGYVWNKPFKKYGVNESCNFIKHSTIYKHMREGVNHSTQKPLSIIDKFIFASSNEGDIVLDPFCGSGTTCVAAKQLGRKYIGFDIKKEYCELTEQRLKKSQYLGSKKNVYEYF